MLLGSFAHKLDDVGRLIIPRKFRYSLGETFVITRGIGCLMVYPLDTFNQVTQVADNLADPFSVLFSPEIARLHRHMYSDAIEVGTDSQGRVQLTPELRAYAGIDKDVIMHGLRDRLEIWAADKWQDYKEENLSMEQLISSAAQTVAEFRAVKADGELPPTGASE